MAGKEKTETLLTVINGPQRSVLMERDRSMEEVRLPLGLQNLLEKEARRRNCTVSALIERAVRADLERGDLDLIRTLRGSSPRRAAAKPQDRPEPPA